MQAALAIDPRGRSAASALGSAAATSPSASARPSAEPEAPNAFPTRETAPAPPPDVETPASPSPGRQGQAGAAAGPDLAMLRARLRSCYSAALREMPDLRGPATLALTHDRSGVVTKVTVECPPVPAVFTECVRDILVGPDGPLRFDGPGRTLTGPQCP